MKRSLASARRPRGEAIERRARHAFGGADLSLPILIERLGEDGAYDGPDVIAGAVKALLLQFVADQPADTEDSPRRRPAARLQLDALKILAELVTQEGTQDNEAELLALLGGAAVDPDAAGD